MSFHFAPPNAPFGRKGLGSSLWEAVQQLAPDQRARIPEFTLGQLVALRFASDEELPQLARKVLDEKLSDRKTIKKMIQNWQPDELRA